VRDAVAAAREGDAATLRAVIAKGNRDDRGASRPYAIEIGATGCYIR